jgi:hypothetical protein
MSSHPSCASLVLTLFSYPGCCFPGSEIYAGCSNGELLRFTLQEDDPNQVCPIVSSGFVYGSDHLQLESYRLLSRQTLPNHKPIDEIVLVPCISRALILSGLSSR